jgi:hypothetical protein
MTTPLTETDVRAQVELIPDIVLEEIQGEVEVVSLLFSMIGNHGPIKDAMEAFAMYVGRLTVGHFITLVNQLQEQIES